MSNLLSYKLCALGLLLALPCFGALQGVIESDLDANLVNNRVWIKNYPLYGFWSYGAAWTNSLDCTQSTGATGGIASCNWSQISGPSTLTFGSPTGTTTSVTGVTFGTYVVQAVVHDGMGNTSTVQQTIGASQCDANGVLIPRDANFTTIFGPTICMGRSPYGFMDERHLAALLQRKAVYDTPFTYSSYTLGNPDWANAQTGTVSYIFNGVGDPHGSTGTTLSSGITSSSTSITVVDATKLNLTTLPTRIMIQAAAGSFGPFEEIRICSAAGNVLTVCYDGRGVDGGGRGVSQFTGAKEVLAAQSWSAGALVGQQLVTGTSTSFLSTLAPGGAGPIGPVKYSTGTVSLTAGSATMTGSGTSWLANVAVDDVVRVAATHSSTAFVFVAYVSAVNSDTSITLNRVFPSDADTASGLSYKDILPFYRYIATTFTRLSPYTGTGNTWWPGTGCEDNTHCFYNIGIYPIDSNTMNNQGTFTGNYSWADLTPAQNYVNQSSLGGVNFYGETLAWISLYERSGLQLAKDAADEIANNWLNYPNFVGGFRIPGSPLFLGGGLNGQVAHYLLYGSPSINDLRPWFAWGFSVNPGSCDAYDTRDSGYLGTAGIMGALFDPDTTSTSAPGGIPWRTYWRNQTGPGAGTLYARDNGCKGTSGGIINNSWANGLLFNTSGPVVTMTNGSAAVTGSGFTTGNCNGIEQGTATVTANSNSITATAGTFSTLAGAIRLAGRYYQFSRTDATHGLISVLWPGSTGSVSYMTVAPVLTNDAGPYVAVYGQSGSDPAVTQDYDCIFNSSSSLTLDRAWTGTSSGGGVTNYQFNYINSLAGFGQQPYMLGIKTYGMKLAIALDGVLGTNYASLSSAAGQWMHDYGFNNENLSIYYGRIYGKCESGGTQVGISQTFIWRIPGCGFGLNPPTVNFQVEGEQLNQEGFSAITKWYQDNANSTNQALVDSYYCAMWCKSGWNAPGITDNASSIGNNTFASNLTDAQLATGKYPGQLFGMGFAASWPALRLTALSSTSITGKVVISGKVVVH